MEQGHRAPRGSKLLAMQKMKDYSLSIFSCLQHTDGDLIGQDAKYRQAAPAAGQSPKGRQCFLQLQTIKGKLTTMRLL